MDQEELVLSDVHLFTKYSPENDVKTHNIDHPNSAHNQHTKQKSAALSRFEFHWDTSSLPDTTRQYITTEDDDGDLVLQRKCRNEQKDVIIISHTLETTLSDVGLQVWRGALLLVDYIIDQNELFHDCVALELGAGVGLVSVVTAMFARHVFCTDIGDQILENCERNVLNNQLLYKHHTSETPVVKVKEYNWLEDEVAMHGGKYSWSDEDIHILDTVTVILAADVVYSNDLTDAFFTKIHSFISKPPAKTVYISIEKRLNFTLDDLDVACPAYEYFRACLDRLTELSCENVSYTIEQLPTDFKQHFQYERIKQLELWKIKAIIKAG